VLSRELITDSIEIIEQIHRLDGIILLDFCDKIVSGMLIAVARLDISAIFVVEGPAESGCRFDYRGKIGSGFYQ
jgi:dihydroxy-acid dehydratase